jgi:hypothetical protein
MLMGYIRPSKDTDWQTGLKRKIQGEREGAEWVVREGVGAGGRNEPSLVCTYE